MGLTRKQVGSEASRVVERVGRELARGLRELARGLGELARALAFPVVAIAIALAIAAIIVWRSGANPITAYAALYQGAFGSEYRIGETLIYATPLILTGLSVAFAFRCGLFNIGAEGQYIVGLIASAWVGFSLHGLPVYLHAPLALLSGALAGAIWAFVPGILKARLGVHEVINTIMMNYISIYFTHYLVTGVLKDPTSMSPVTPRIAETARLARVSGFGRLHVGIFIAMGVAVLMYLLLFRTTVGYQIRAVGLNPNAARYAGISVTRNLVIAMVVSGALAGLAGAIQVQGVQRRFMDLFAFPGYGFDGIAVALLGQNHPIGVVLASFLFGSLSSGAMQMQSTADIPKDLVGIIQATVIFLVAADMVVKRLISRRQKSMVAHEDHSEPNEQEVSPSGVDVPR